MKIKILIITAISVFAALYGYMFYYIATDGTEVKKYCGPVISMGKEEPSSGYKSSRDAVYYIIIRDTDCGKAVRVNVTVPTYFGAKEGQNMCFDLSSREMQNYGNTTERVHLK